MITTNDARTIARIIASADMFCTVCALALADEMQTAFPNFDWRNLVQNSGKPLVENPQSEMESDE